jgi:hypothetical protein
MAALSGLLGECACRSLVREVTGEYVAGLSSDLGVVVVA